MALNHRAVLAALVLLIGPGFRAIAEDNVWLAAANGSWEDPNRWSLRRIPTTADTAVLPDHGLPYTVTLSAPRSCLAIRIESPLATLRLFSGSTPVLTVSADSVIHGAIALDAAATNSGINTGIATLTIRESGSLLVQAGTGTRTIAGRFINLGTIVLSKTLALYNGAILEHSGGVLRGSGDSLLHAQSPGKLRWRGGLIEEEFRMYGGLDIPPDSTGSGFITVAGNTYLWGGVCPNQTLRLGGRLYLMESLSNRGVIRTSLNAHIEVDPGRIFTNSPDGHIVIEAGSPLLEGLFVDDGTLEGNAAIRLFGDDSIYEKRAGVVRGSIRFTDWSGYGSLLRWSGGTFEGTASGIAGSVHLNIPADSTGAGTLRITGGIQLTGYVNRDQTLFCDGGAIRVVTTAANSGRIVLDSSGTLPSRLELAPINGWPRATLTNNEDGLIRFSNAGGGTGTCVWAGVLRNRGTILVESTITANGIGVLMEGGLIDASDSEIMSNVAVWRWSGGEIRGRIGALDCNLEIPEGSTGTGHFLVRQVATLFGVVGPGQVLHLDPVSVIGAFLHMYRGATRGGNDGTIILDGNSRTELSLGEAVTSRGTIVVKPGGQRRVSLRSLAIEGHLIVEPGALVEFLEPLALLPGALVRFGVAGPLPQQHGRISARRNAALAGRIALERRSGYVASLGDSLTLITAEDLTGAFDCEHIADDPPDPKYRFTSEALTSYYIAHAVLGRGLVGDLDCDCSTGLSDLTILLSMFGANAGTPAAGDIDHDGDVDLQDLVRLLAEFGSDC